MTTSPLASPSATKALLERFGLETKYRFGQNFLIDNHVIEHIIALSDLSGDELVLEIGPGIGTLTLALLSSCARVVSVELDTDLEPVLATHAQAHLGFRYLMGDALKVDSTAIEQALGGIPQMLIANLPYNVAATVILDLFQKLPSLQRAVVMVQKEVADRICASEGSRTYGAYTAKLSLLARVTGRFEVPPRCFMPAPRVDSAVVRLDRQELPLTCSYAATARVIDAAFAQRRKTIRNSMAASGFSKDELDRAFAACGIDAAARAETLSPQRFVDLSAALLDTSFLV